MKGYTEGIPTEVLLAELQKAMKSIQPAPKVQASHLVPQGQAVRFKDPVFGMDTVHLSPADFEEWEQSND